MATFPSLGVNLEIQAVRHELWADLEPVDFLFAVDDFCRNGKMYRETNLVSEIRERALKHKSSRRNSQRIVDRRQFERDSQEDCIPPPEWFKTAMTQLIKKVSVH